MPKQARWKLKRQDYLKRIKNAPSAEDARLKANEYWEKR